MNKHTKIAIFIAPFLLLGGYIASDYYLEYKAQQKRVFQLSPEGHCDVINQKCVLSAGEFQVNIYDEQGQTHVNSTFPIDNAVLFIVGDETTAYPMAMKDSPYYWHQKTPLREIIGEKGQKQKLRVIVGIKGGQYISEFYTSTNRDT